MKRNKYDIIIAVDKGLEILDILNIKPNYIVGDFDSIKNKILEKYENSDIEIKRLNPEKDFTDTHSALKLAIELKSTHITIIGAIGTRLDHTISNIHILKYALDNNVDAKIVNERNEIGLINRACIIKKDNTYRYISLIPLTTDVKGITLKGLKYIVKDGTFKVGDSIGVSNEQIEEEAIIEIKQGLLMVIRSKD